MSATLLNAVGIGLRRRRRDILVDIDFHADAGEVVGLIGPNGAGKSTLLRVSAGVLAADRGRVEIDGHDVATTSPRTLARCLALVEQHPSTPAGFTARDYVLLARHAHLARFAVEGAGDVRAVDEALRSVGVEALADQDVTTMSGGERQLVAIARGMAQEPRLLFLDEPTSALDLGHQMRVLDLVRRLAHSGVAVVVAVHDLALAARMCDRLVLMQHGHIVATGAVNEVLTPPLLHQAYGVETIVRACPDTGGTLVTPLCASTRPLPDFPHPPHHQENPPNDHPHLVPSSPTGGDHRPGHAARGMRHDHGRRRRFRQ